ncbi:MAG: phosphatase PAP2 family protein [Actinobacteria bacterium]|nr:phosphatase PAP2 family protein [Actinomycetota bacterium]
MAFSSLIRSKPILQLLAGWISLLLVGWAAGEFATNYLTTADLEAVTEVAAGRSAGLTALSHVLSFLGSGYWVTPVTVILCLALFRIGRRLDSVAMALSVIGASALSSADKLLVGRPRPPVEHLETVTTSSFPSGHSTSAGALYVALLLVFLRGRPRRPAAVAAGIAATLMMVGVALSRVYLGVHYPSDVIAGLLLGSGWSLLVGATITHAADEGRPWRGLRPKP